MKKTIEQGKIWLIAVVISLSSYLYMQADQQHSEPVQTASIPAWQSDQLEEEQDFSVPGFDLVKGMTLVFIDLVLHKQ